MKLAAKEVKVGQTVKYVNELVVVESIEQTFQKNGKRNIIFTGTRLAGIVKRRNGDRPSPIHEKKDYKVGFGENTMVTVK